MTWITTTLRTYPEIAIFIALAVGYYAGGKTWRGIGLGAVTATLIAGVVIGQLDIPISPNVKSIFFLLFLFAVGFGVGPQFVRGIAKDGLPQALFAVVMALLSLGAAYLCARLAGYDVGYAAGLFAGSQTLSASMGLATDAINRLGQTAAQTHALLNAIPVAYAVTYIFGTIGSAIFLAMVAPRLLRIDLVAECKAFEASMAGPAMLGGEGSAWHDYEVRAYRFPAASPLIGKTVTQAEALLGPARVFVERLRRAGVIVQSRSDTVVQADDVLALAGPHAVLVRVIEHQADEIEDAELLSMPMEGVDVYVTGKRFDGKTLSDLAHDEAGHGVFLRKITRGATAADIPILPMTQVHRGDILTLTGRLQDTTAAAKALGFLDRGGPETNVAFVAAGITIGALVGAVSVTVWSVPLTLSTAGGVLIAGLICGWLRSVHPAFGRVPSAAVWFMNSVGLNVFIAVVGISAGPSFVKGLQQVGVSLFLWGVFATTLPLLLGIFIGRYVFRFHPAVLLGCVAGARTTTASLGLICEAAKSQVPSLGYTVTYAVGNTLLTIWGLVIVLLLT